jgi:hypothetical protein
MNNPAEQNIVTGKVNIHADRIVLSVDVCKFFTPLDATIEPAIPEDNMCVVDTGNLNAVDNPIVIAATNSAVAPCA